MLIKAASFPLMLQVSTRTVFVAKCLYNVILYAGLRMRAGRRWAAGSIGHSNSETTRCANLIAQKVFGLARSAALKVAGFPRFEEAIQELQSLQTVQTPSYEVTVALPDGTLVVKDAVLDLWQRKHTDFAQECSALLEDHDKEFNPKHVRRGGSEVNDNSTCELPNKKLVTEGTLDKEEFEKNRADRHANLSNIPHTRVF